jgi:drug/metabolite transporter (DMT)-like permease
VSPAVVALVLASALVHAAWNALLKRHRDPEAAVVPMIAASALCAVAVALAARVPFPAMAPLGWSVASGLFEAGYVTALAAAMARAPMGVVYTVTRGGGLVLVWPVSVAFLGERATALGLAGAALVVLGLVGAAWSPRPATAVPGIASGPSVWSRSRAGLLWAVLGAVFIAGYLLCYKRALATGGAPEACVAASLTVAAVANLARVHRRRDHVIAVARATPWATLGIGFLANASFLLFLYALAHGGTGATSTLRNASVIFAMIFSWALGERPRRQHVLGAVAVACGAVLLAWPR